MDVRCESCHTEYELEDGNVKETGTEVQCTSCGHTFTVYPTGVTPPGAAGAHPPSTGSRPSLAAAEFLLETADGRTHRLRELTMLQKWIIERKVTRADRISRHGQPWARLGTLEDLAPFFDVVDEADRARAAVGRGFGGERDDAGRSGRGSSLPTGAGPAHLVPGPAHPPSTGGRSAPGTDAGPSPRTTPEGQRAVNRSLELLAVEAPVPADEPDTSIVVRPGGGRAWWKMLVTFGVAGGVFYFGIRALPGLMVQGQKLGATGQTSVHVGAFSREGATKPTGESAVAPSGEPAAPPLGADGSAQAVASPDPLAPPAPASAGGNPTPSPSPSGPEAVGQAAAPATSVPAVPAAPIPAAEPAAPAVARDEVAAPAPTPANSGATRSGAKARAARATGAASGEDVPYDRLIAQADRMLENGANERALRVYERALVVRPDAPEALTGIGYVHLDKNRNGTAIEFFTRASAASPFAPALFGLGQAYRAAGDPVRARQTYQRYLALYPTGSDAPAAERQLQALSQANAGEAPASILHEAGEGARPAAPAEPAK
jgi:predicted Zn finger-like uncharacterized protein